MVGNGVKYSSEKGDIQSGYTTMARSPPSSLPPVTHSATSVPHHTSINDEIDDTPIDIAEAGSIRPPQGATQRFVRHYRVLEFGSSLLLYLLALVFAKIELHERPIPGIKVRLNSTAVAWSLDPSIDEIKLSEEGKSKSARALHCSKSLTIIVDCDTLSANVAIADAGDLFTSGNKSRRQLRTPEVLPGAGDRPRHARLPA
ncbi:unnamed protein product [Phytophthora fragariaefolia]|uniref:Unnamed protein product n=1 Tax=Phytophthora fragariaefolia TaxID=1490495 RepID=A0A9W6YBH7_9STRA|nr:unnamed protein product [Phytophthora fragariaefolia]